MYWFSRCGPWISHIRITMELVENANVNAFLGPKELKTLRVGPARVLTALQVILIHTQV